MTDQHVSRLADDFCGTASFIYHLIRIKLRAEPLSPFNSSSSDKLESRNQKWKYNCTKLHESACAGPSCATIITAKLVDQESLMKASSHFLLFGIGSEKKKALSRTARRKPQQSWNELRRMLYEERKEAFRFSRCDSILPQGNSNLAH